MATSKNHKIQYRSLDEAIKQDVSQPEFDPQTLQFEASYSRSTGSAPSTSSVVSLRRSLVHSENPSKPSPLYSLRTSSALLRRRPLVSGFEIPYWKDTLLHSALCLVSYPILLAVTIFAHNKTIFWARFIVSAGCGLVGLGIGYSLLTLAKNHLEAASKFFRIRHLLRAEAVFVSLGHSNPPVILCRFPRCAAE